MSIVLRWKTKYRKTSFMCQIFGHKWASGWWGSIPYLRVKDGVGITDGIGRVHLELTCLCDRCGVRTTVAKMHKPEKT